MPRAGASSASFGPPTRHLPGAPPAVEFTGKVLASVLRHVSAAHPRGCHHMHGPDHRSRGLERGAPGAPGSSALGTEHGFFSPTPTHVPAARLFVISKRNAPVGVPTTGADLKGDLAKDVRERPALPSLPCLSQPSSIKDNVRVSSCTSLATSSAEKALLWEWDIRADRRWPLQTPRRTGTRRCLPF